MNLPNILIFVPDEMRGDTVNNPIVQVPNMESLAKDGNGVIFTNNFSVNPVCGPSRVCTFTGTYPMAGGHRSLYQLLRPGDENLFKLLKEKGYEVIWIGRNDLFHKKAVKKSVTKRISLMRTLLMKLTLKLGPIKLLKMLSKARSAFNNMSVPSELLDIVKKIWPLNPWPIDHPMRNTFYYGKSTEEQANNNIDKVSIEAGLKYLDKIGKLRKKGNNKKPFCLYIALGAPHPPYVIEEPYFSMYDREKIPSPFPNELMNDPSFYDDKPAFMKLIHERYGLDKLTDKDYKEILAVYYGMISKVDDQFGQLIDKLKEIGEYDNTAITVFADHGDYAGSYGLTEKHATGMHDCLNNVPFIVKIPGTEPKKSINTELTQTIDIFATLLEIAQIETEYTHFSKSLIPLMKGEIKTHRDIVYAQGGYDEWEKQAWEDVVSSPEDPLKGIYFNKIDIHYKDPSTNCRTTMIRTKEWKLNIRSYIEAKEELYNMKEDPQELINLIDDPQYADIIQDLKNKMLYWYLKNSDNPHYYHKREV
ncbi:MAG: sulfatase-like hydrolase/transferase [archaeon]|nr:sulfatase-like hydrolase/transferase [archaeon]